MNEDSSNYLSPFTWRYGSNSMRYIFSEKRKYELWRTIWVSLAHAQHKAGLVSKEELADLKKNETTIDIDRILEIEKETKHDIVAAIKEFAEKAKVGGGKIHLGATSMDIMDNADSLKIKEALELTKNNTIKVLNNLYSLIDTYKDTPCMGYTHIQPAEPTTLGYRFSFYAQDLLHDLSFLDYALDTTQTKGFKGAVGTSASYIRLLADQKITAEDFEQSIMDTLGLRAAPVTTQTYSRKNDFLILSVLASIAQSLSKFALDIRVMQSPLIAEWSEPFGKAQVGSSAMPFKRNPINSEKICSLARYVAQFPRVMWDNASLSILERTLDDSANRRIVIPDAFLATDEILNTANTIISGLHINEVAIKRNLDQYGPFAAIEVILLEAVKKGANRQDMHEELRTIALKAQENVAIGKPNPLMNLLKSSTVITSYLSSKEIEILFDPKKHVGLAPKTCRSMLKKIKNSIQKDNEK